MNKLLVITLLIGLLSFGTQGFRMPRQAEGEEAVPEEPVPEEPIAEEVAPEAPEAPEAHEEVAPEEPAPEAAPEHQGPDAHQESEEPTGVLTNITGYIRNAFYSGVDRTSGLIETVRNMKLDEKAKYLYDETASTLSTYSGMVQDKIVDMFYTQ